MINPHQDKHLNNIFEIFGCFVFKEDLLVNFSKEFNHLLELIRFQSLVATYDPVQ